ncbi:uncharacterized protein V6R79_015520 [Siganus canaliculatus]
METQQLPVSSQSPPSGRQRYGATIHCTTSTLNVAHSIVTIVKKRSFTYCH